MKAYVDSDVILDVLLGREYFLFESSQILQLCETQKIMGCTTVLALANMHYILNRYDKKNAKKAIQTLRTILTVMPISDHEMGRSLESDFKDFEDGVQNFTAEKNDCELIITRNKKDYATSQLNVVTPHEYLLQNTASLTF
ncbi:MAG: PIN domain-containing protein [Mariprofundaceae bacterium]|nr:PIN domain-containing protein [Mariprofundaceae bacterium]